MIDELQSIGFTKGESKVYVALLNLGLTTVGPVTIKSGVSKSKIYEILDRLLKKGLVNYMIKDRTKHYQAIEPSRIDEFIREQEKKIDKARNKFEEILPLLKRIESKKPKQEAEIFKGIKGMKVAYSLFMNGIPKDEEIVFTYIYDEKNKIEIDKFYGSLPYYKSHKWKGIMSQDYRKTDFVKEMHKNIKMKKTSIPIPTNLDISKEKVLMVDWSSTIPTAILIHSRDIAKNHREYFKKVWKSIK